MTIEEGDIWDEMRLLGKYNWNTYGQRPDCGSINTLRGVQPANKTRT